MRYNSDAPKRIHSRVKSRAKKSGIPFNIDVEDIIVPIKCPVLGTLLNPKPAEGSGYHPNAASLDKIIPKLGYVKGNVRVISARANLLKNDATADELELVLKDLRDIENGRNT